MEFDKSRVYTALNADELKQGDKVIVANSLNSLKRFVEKMLEKPDGLNPNGIYVKTIYRIRDFSSDYRFDVKPSNPARPSYPYAYLVERAENCTNCGNKYCSTPFAHKETSVCDRYEPKTEQKAEKHYRPFKDVEELLDHWYDKTGMRHPDGLIYGVSSLTMPYIWVRNKSDSKVWLITEFDNRILDYLFTNCEFLDGSPCGVEE